MNGALAFVDTSDCTMMNIAEHYMASDVEWDPTGRFVVTSVSWWSHKVGFFLFKSDLWMREKKKYKSLVVPPPLCSLQLNTSVNTNAGRQRVLAVDVSRATATEKQQRPFLPAAVATSSSLSPLPGADKGDVGMHNRIYVNIKKHLFPLTLNFVISLNLPGHQEGPEEVLKDL